MPRSPVLFLCLGLLACGPKGSPGEIPDDGPKREGVAVLGWNANDVTKLRLTELASAADGLATPRDLAFNTYVPGELWVVNRADDSTVTFWGVGTDEQSSEKRIDGYALHFMEETSSIAFGAPERFGTCGETRNTYNGQAPPNDFMGPALWSSDMDVYAREDPIGLGSHLDMLHETPLCMGIAWEADNVYWVFDGNDGAIVRYDFQHDHGPGYDDHSDGIIHRYVSGQVKREPDVPSHLVLDHASKKLYVADTGNSRVAVLDTASGTLGAVLSRKEAGTVHRRVDGGVLETLVDAESSGLQRPSGIALFGGVLYVGDNATSILYAFSLDGTLIDWVDLGLPEGSLMGLEFDPAGNLYFVDAVGESLYRLQPLD